VTEDSSAGGQPPAPFPEKVSNCGEHRLEERIREALGCDIKVVSEPDEGPLRLPREVAEALVSHIEELERLDATKNQFVSIASHELRTPIAVVHGIASTLHLRGNQLSREQLGELRQTLFAQTTRLATLTEQLLDLSRLDADAYALHPERFRPCERIQELLFRIAPDRVDDIDLEVEPELEVVTDPHGFERVVANLITNALRYGKPPVEVIAEPSDVVELVVEDHGPGVPAAFVPHLFDRFAQADGAVRGHGAGLGLAIAKSYAEALGGDLQYEPAEPSGARFRFALPRDLAA
jgi:two-component system sensor histidine kinase MtrB